MTINHIIIHELDKKGGVSEAKLQTYDTVLDHSDERVGKLVTEINDRYINKNEIYGVFDKKNPTTFHTSFEKYFNDNLSETEFISFSKLASENLRERIEGNAPAKGGYLIFVNYVAARKYVGVFLVRNRVGLSFDTKKKKMFNINNVNHIDFENLAMACRINTAGFGNTEMQYLSFISSNGDEMSKYFTRWISSAQTDTNRANTLLLYDLMNEIELPNKGDSEEKYDRVEFLDAIYKSVYTSGTKLVNLRTLSESFYGDANYIPNHVEKKAITINGEFKPHSTTFKKFIQVRVKADKIELSFPNSLYKDTVTISGEQVIIKSENLVNAIRDRISRRDEQLPDA